MHSNLRACWYTTVSFSAYNSLLDRITMLFQSATKAVNKAIEKNVAFVPGDPFYVNEKNVNTLRLNYTNADTETIKEGIKRLASVL